MLTYRVWYRHASAKTLNYPLLCTRSTSLQSCIGQTRSSTSWVTPAPLLSKNTATAKDSSAQNPFAEIETTSAEADSEESTSQPAKKLKPEKRLLDPKLANSVQRRLNYINDPWNIADHVEERLKKGLYEEALAFVRSASATKPVVVSWNILIRHCFEQQRLHAAIKLYNEMRKRGQPPNMQTYTTIFAGCAKSQHPQLATAEAVRIYHSLLNGGRIEPNTIHLNAVLEVCGRAGDIDSMLSLVGTASHASRQIDHITYATLLNALRFQAQETLASQSTLSTEQKDEIALQAIQRAKNIWQDVIHDWQKGKIRIDERLVCIMGRTLLLGPVPDKLNVLSLLSQTMNIPNLRKKNTMVIESAPLSEEDTATAALFDHKKPQDLKDPTKTLSVTGQPSERNLATSGGGYVTPTQNTLSLVLRVLADMRLTGLAIEYWNLLVVKLKIAPDAENWKCFLLCLKRGHSSGRIVTFLNQMPTEFMNDTTFQIAIDTCLRDINNRSVRKNANKIITLMLKTLDSYKPSTLRSYLQLYLVTSNLAIRQKGEDKSEAELAEAHWSTMKIAIETIFNPIKKMLETVKKKLPKEQLEDRSGPLYNEAAEIAATARKLVSVMDSAMAPEAKNSDAEKPPIDFSSKRNHLNRYILEFYQAGIQDLPEEKSSKKGKKTPQDADNEDDAPRKRYLLHPSPSSSQKPHKKEYSRHADDQPQKKDFVANKGLPRKEFSRDTRPLRNVGRPPRRPRQEDDDLAEDRDEYSDQDQSANFGSFSHNKPYQKAYGRNNDQYSPEPHEKKFVPQIERKYFQKEISRDRGKKFDRPAYGQSSRTGFSRDDDRKPQKPYTRQAYPRTFDGSSKQRFFRKDSSLDNEGYSFKRPHSKQRFASPRDLSTGPRSRGHIIEGFEKKRFSQVGFSRDRR